MEELANSPRQITWLIENFDEVYALMMDDLSPAAQKQAFFEFRANRGPAQGQNDCDQNLHEHEDQ